MSIDEDPEDYKQNKKLNLYFKFHGVTSNFNESLTNLYTHTHTHLVKNEHKQKFRLGQLVIVI